jgi:acyl-CoA reductase-like NAD-dependent aldehyde dehydrogenase
VQRLYAHASIFELLREKLLERIGELPTGNPLDGSTVVGGLIDEPAAEKAEALVQEAVSAGGRVLCGGTREGTVLAPTLLVDVPEELRVCAEEAFAPIVVLASYHDVDDAIARANDSPFGLQAGLFSNDIRVINRAFERLQVGALIVNDVNTFRVDQMPYGGAKRSGHGREGMRWAIREMTEERLLVIDPR